MDNDNDVPLADLRPRLISAMLVHVPFEGWTAAARDAAAGDLGSDPDIAAMALPDATSMCDAYTALADARMTAAMAEANVSAMKVRERIRMALTVRLENARHDKEAVRRALALMALPANAAMGLRTLWRTADTMWRAAGDTSTDFNHYSKRAILASVYSAVLLYWLDDDSEDMADTRAFIERRIDGVIGIEKAKAQARGMVDWLPDPARFLGRLRYPVS
ncbi:COQ9 family protein [Polymorphobacter sp.]|uniref:COQ9 family protein n=1 Tax=Polymorphobacter sp. TaxID=1909290 RepID=UPI003F71C8EB